MAHPYDDAIDTWLRSPEMGDRAMARNIMHDHRVSEKRAESFDAFVKENPTADDLHRAVVDYFLTKVRHRELPDFVDQAVNGKNLLTGKGMIQPLIHRDVKLVRVLDLNGLIPVYHWALIDRNKKREWKKSLAEFRIKPDDYEVAAWLDDKIGGGSAGDVEEMVATVLDILNTYSREVPFQPTWATTWAAFKPQERYGPDRWLQIMGMGQVPRPPRWVILLTYTVAEAGTLVRPTILDAGWYAYHFPSPHQAPLSTGGHPMDLRINPRADQLLPEYIHKQIPHTLQHWKAAGSRIGRTITPNRDLIADQRNAHHELLASIYGRGLYAWMDRPV